jgi:hypothetical protein
VSIYFLREVIAGRKRVNHRVNFNNTLRQLFKTHEIRKPNVPHIGEFCLRDAWQQMKDEMVFKRYFPDYKLALPSREYFFTVTKKPVDIARF